MRGEVANERAAHDVAFGAWLIETIAQAFEVEPDPAKIDRAVYKRTDCGAWLKFDEDGIMVGTIVEGSDAEYSERIAMTDSKAELVQRVFDAMENCEAFADEHFNTGDEDEII